MTVTFSNPATVAPPVGAYSHVARVAAGTELLFIAGQVGVAPDGSLPEAPEDQYAQALRNIAAILATEGATPADLVKLNSYLVTPMAADQVRAIRVEILGDAVPAATLVYVPRLAAEAFLAEVEAVAVRPA